MDAINSNSDKSLVGSLTKDGHKWHKANGRELVLTYSFTSPTVTDTVYGGKFTNLSCFTDEQQRIALRVLEKVAAQTGLEFRIAEDGENSNLTFANYSHLTTGVLGFAYMPSQFGKAGTTPIWMNTARCEKSQDFEAVLTHEIGHALGLDHAENDKSLMYAYYDFHQSHKKFQDADIEALQNLYGVDTRRPTEIGVTGDSVTLNYEQFKTAFEHTSDETQRQSIVNFFREAEALNYKVDRSSLDSTKQELLAFIQTTLAQAYAKGNCNNDECKIEQCAEEKYITLSHEMFKSAYDNTANDKRKELIVNFWNEAHLANYKINVRSLDNSRELLLNMIQQKDIRITVDYRAIKDFYEQTINDNEQARKVSALWDQLHVSNYQIKMQELTVEQEQLLNKIGYTWQAPIKSDRKTIDPSQKTMHESLSSHSGNKDGVNSIPAQTENLIIALASTCHEDGACHSSGFAEHTHYQPANLTSPA